MAMITRSALYIGAERTAKEARPWANQAARKREGAVSRVVLYSYGVRKIRKESETSEEAGSLVGSPNSV